MCPQNSIYKIESLSISILFAKPPLRYLYTRKLGRRMEEDQARIAEPSIKRLSNQIYIMISLRGRIHLRNFGDFPSSSNAHNDFHRPGKSGNESLGGPSIIHRLNWFVIPWLIHARLRVSRWSIGEFLGRWPSSQPEWNELSYRD